MREFWPEPIVGLPCHGKQRVQMFADQAVSCFVD